MTELFPEVPTVVGSPVVGDLPTGPFGVVYADPPWRYSVATTTPTRAIEEQYPTMALEDICALPVDASTDDDAVLFMWAKDLPRLVDV